MKLLTPLLAAAVLVSGGTTMHYTHALRQLRAQHSPPPPGAEASYPAFAPPAATPDNPLAAQAREDVYRGIGSPHDPGGQAIARHMVAELRDPQSRAWHLQKATDRERSTWQSYVPLMDMTDDEFERFVTGLAGKELLREERLWACRSDPDCDAAALRNQNDEERNRSLTEALGARLITHLDMLQGAAAGRFGIDKVLQQLPVEARLSESQVDSLGVVLAQEHLRVSEEARRDGLAVGVPSRGALLRGMAVPDAPDAPAQWLASAERHAQRVRERAAGVLSGQALEAFNAMLRQEQADFAQEMRELAEENAARNAAHR